MPEDDIFFTTVTHPKQFRKRLLESSKEIIFVLKDYQSIHSIREKKKEKIQDINKQFDELMELMQELDGFLPEEFLHELEEVMKGPEPEGESESEEEDKEGVPDESEEESSEDKEDESSEGELEGEPEEDMSDEEKEKVDELEHALNSIESKLDQL